MTGAPNSQKTPLGWSLNAFASGKTNDAIQLLSKALPCHVVSIVSGGIVQVQFDVTSDFTFPGNVTMPVAESIYVRLPVQVGDKGVAIAADAYLGGVSGLGGGTADLSQRGNLTPLVFVPVANTGWATVNNNQVIVQGPAGSVVQDIGEKTIITVDGSDVTILVPSGKHVTISSGGTTQPVKLADDSNSVVLLAQ